MYLQASLPTSSIKSFNGIDVPFLLLNFAIEDLVFNETIWFRGECKRLVKERDEAQDALANALEVNESHQRLNGKLQVRIAELEEDSMKMHKRLDKQVEAARKAGM